MARLLAVLPVLGVFAVVVTLVDGDADLFGRIAFARDAARAGQLLLTVDPYSCTAGPARWVDHEWGFNWLGWAFYSLGGFPGVRLLRVLLFAAAAALSLAPVWRRTRSALALAAVAALWSLGAYGGFYGPRAQSVGYLLFAWMLFCFERSWRAGTRWVLYGVLPLVVWVNVHAGFVAGLGVAGAWGVLRLVQCAREKDRTGAAWILAAGAVTTMALVVNPFGLHLVRFAVEKSLMERPYIPEWAPLELGSRELWVALLLVLVALGKLAEKPLRWPDLVVLGAVAVVTFRHARHLPFLATAVTVLAVPVGVETVRAIWSMSLGRRPWHVPVGLRWAALVLLAIASLGVPLAVADAVVRPPPREPLFPAAAIEYLRAARPGACGIVEFNWSMYALFHAPEVQHAFDGRYTDLYDDAATQRYFRWHFAEDGPQPLLDDARLRFALVATGSDRDRMMAQRAGWTAGHRDALATVYVR